MTTTDSKGSDLTNSEPGSAHRRTLLKGAAWTVPVVAVSAAIPSAAASGPVTGPSNWHFGIDGGGVQYNGAGTLTTQGSIYIQWEAGGAATTGITSVIGTLEVVGTSDYTFYESISFTLVQTGTQPRYYVNREHTVPLGPADYTWTITVTSIIDSEGKTIPLLVGKENPLIQYGSTW